jgi:hypothetical protein
MFERGLLRRIFIFTRKKVNGGRRKLQNGGLHNLHFPPDIIRIIKTR